MKYQSFYLFFIISLFLEVESFIPGGRLAHSSVLVENKLYFLGGVVDNDNNFCSNEVFYLDVSKPFNMQAPLWTDLTPNAGIPFRSCFGSVSLNKINNEQTIFLFGGITLDIATNNDYFPSIIYSLNLNSLKWNTPAVKGNPPARRKETKSITDSGKMYTFSGVVDNTIGSTTVQYLNDMTIFNTADSSWSIISTPVSGRASYTATLLEDGNIVYIGGYEDTPKDVDISQIILYNTKSSTWITKV
jgi:N-acetylneuraminic acid mutarotase